MVSPFPLGVQDLFVPMICNLVLLGIIFVFLSVVSVVRSSVCIRRCIDYLQLEQEFQFSISEIIGLISEK
jgi:ABC-type microcin C transport system permease subunit YejE